MKEIIKIGVTNFVYATLIGAGFTMGVICVIGVLFLWLR